MYRKSLFILTFLPLFGLSQTSIFNGTAKNSMLLQGKDTTYLKSSSGYFERSGGTLTPKTATDTIRATQFNGDQSEITTMKSGLTKIHNTGNLVNISPDSAIQLHGNSTVWDDLFFPFTTANKGVAAYPAFVADSNYYAFTVDSTSISKCVMYFLVQLPHKWKEGSVIYPHVHYKHTTTQGTPTFVVKYRWANITGVFGAWSWIRVNSTTGTTANTHQLVTNSTGIAGTNKTFSSMLQIELYLMSSTGNNTCSAYQMDIHIEISRLGTNTEL